MARRKAKPKTTSDAAANPIRAEQSDQRIADSAPRERALRVLIVDGSDEIRAHLTEMLSASGMASVPASTLAEAREAMAADNFEVVLCSLDLLDGRGCELASELRISETPTRVVLRCSEPTMEDALDAMRSGAVDLLGGPIERETLVATVQAAGDQAQAARRAADRTERLLKMCERLNDAREQVTSQVDTLCNDLAGAYEELADKVSHAALAGDFNAVIQQELDIEALLRAALEFMLTKTGPTNAAVFLPSNHSDFSLGAYVNYDCPKDTADVLLDHLADVIAPRFQDEVDVVQMRDNDDLEAWIGDDANWLVDSGVMVYSCRHDDECLAVIALFRDGRNPFPPELPGQLEVMGDLFGRQLARVVEVHHRHKLNEEWAGWDEWSEDADEDDYGDLAA